MCVVSFFQKNIDYDDRSAADVIYIIKSIAAEGKTYFAPKNNIQFKPSKFTYINNKTGLLQSKIIFIYKL